MNAKFTDYSKLFWLSLNTVPFFFKDAKLIPLKLKLLTSHSSNLHTTLIFLGADKSKQNFIGSNISYSGLNRLSSTFAFSLSYWADFERAYSKSAILCPDTVN